MFYFLLYIIIYGQIHTSWNINVCICILLLVTYHYICTNSYLLKHKCLHVFNFPKTFKKKTKKLERLAIAIFKWWNNIWISETYFQPGFFNAKLASHLLNLNLSVDSSNPYFLARLLMGMNQELISTHESPLLCLSQSRGFPSFCLKQLWLYGFCMAS